MFDNWLMPKLICSTPPAMDGATDMHVYCTVYTVIEREHFHWKSRGGPLFAPVGFYFKHMRATPFAGRTTIPFHPIQLLYWFDLAFCTTASEQPLKQRFKQFVCKQQEQRKKNKWHNGFNKLQCLSESVYWRKYMNTCRLCVIFCDKALPETIHFQTTRSLTHKYTHSLFIGSPVVSKWRRLILMALSFAL